MKARIWVSLQPVFAMSVYWSDSTYLDLTIRELLDSCNNAGLDSENTTVMLEYWAEQLAEEFRSMGFSDAVDQLQGEY